MSIDAIDEEWHLIQLPAPMPTYPIDVDGIAASIFWLGSVYPRAQGYVTHPEGNPPPFDISHMHELGFSTAGDRVLQFPDPTTISDETVTVVCPGTPRLPWTLLHEPPAMQTVADSIFDDIPEIKEGPPDELLAEYWNPVADTRLSKNSTPAEGWGLPGGRIENTTRILPYINPMYFVVFSILKINVIPCFLSWTDSTLFYLVLVSTPEVVVFTSGLFPRFVRPIRLPAGHRPGPDSLAVYVTTPCSSMSLLFHPIHFQPLSGPLPVCLAYIPTLYRLRPGPARLLPGLFPTIAGHRLDASSSSSITRPEASQSLTLLSCGVARTADSMMSGHLPVPGLVRFRSSTGLRPLRGSGYNTFPSYKNPTTSAQDGENASPSDELEEGELIDQSESCVQSWIADPSTHPRTADPRLRTRADHVPIPAIGSARHGLVITRTCYSSSPSVALSNSTVDHSISGRQPYIRSPLLISERLAEADQIITEAVRGVSFDSLFDLEYDTDSPPDLMGLYITVRTTDCLEAMAAMCREAPTPDRDPEIRNAELEDLLEWNRQQERLQDAMDILCVYLEDLVDQDAMRVEACGGRSRPEALVKTTAEDTLDLVSQCIGGSKHKVCDDLIVTVTRDGKCLRRMGGDADYLTPLILMQGFVCLFIAQAYDLAIQCQYRIDVPSNLQGNDISLLFLGWIDFVKLSLLHSVFTAQGQKDIADDVAALLQVQFRDS
ncbi:hypothetical protein B0H13DRAFT_2386684 [Mycena leptocephala]|nr:hypothetical protein B0H13DRAFT_2386684 [Mycena leptocephala]